MGLLSTLGTIGGSLLGGPVGGAIGGALGGYLDGNEAADAAQAAAGQTAAATNQATQLQREMWQAQQEQQKPWLQAGVSSLNRMQGGEFAVPGAFQYSGQAPDAFKFDASQMQLDPGYAFRLSEGQKALDRSAAARGGMISGAALKAATRFGQDMGSQEFQNAYNRGLTAYNSAVQREQQQYGRAMDQYNSQVQQSNTGYNRLASLAGIGQTATNTLGAAGQQYGQNVGNAMINQGYTQGNALIAGQQGRASTYGNIGTALGKVTPEQWSSAGNALTSWLNPTYSGQGPTGYAP